ncbi:MAG: DUF1272 domain-containing protein [Hyphomicrobium sp.]
MLQFRTNCECCNKDLPPDATDARICSYECTYCEKCVEEVLSNVCPTCGGGFERRPIRPSTAVRPGLSLVHQPASTERVPWRYSREEVAAVSSAVKDIPPHQR